MAGVVNGEVWAWNDGTYSVLPDRCPVEDPHREHEPTCYTTYPDAAWRACPYWMATTAVSNGTDRRHPSQLRIDAVSLGAKKIRCGIVCLQARRNRPPGC